MYDCSDSEICITLCLSDGVSLNTLYELSLQGTLLVLPMSGKMPWCEVSL